MEVRGYRGVDKYVPHLLGHEGCGQVVSGNVKIKVGDWAILGWIKVKELIQKNTYNIGNQKINSAQ